MSARSRRTVKIVALVFVGAALALVAWTQIGLRATGKGKMGEECSWFGGCRGMSCTRRGLKFPRGGHYAAVGYCTRFCLKDSNCAGGFYSCARPEGSLLPLKVCMQTTIVD